eukprot:Hpha_TRINITY_DN7829_c0_g1::TRINITY_DN7829_c0_g1_i1::g.185707::m.185707
MAGDEKDAAKAADAKVRLRTLSQAEARRRLQEVGVQQCRVRKELRRVERSLRQPELDTAERCSLKQREGVLLGQEALCLKQQSSIRRLRAADAQLTMLSPWERRAQDTSKDSSTWKALLAPDRDAAEQESAAGYVTSLREALQRHQRGCELQLPPTPRSDQTGDGGALSPQQCMRLVLQPPRKKPAEWRRDPSDGRFKSKAEFLKGHSIGDWKKAETMEQRREHRKQEGQREWLRRKQAETEEVGRCIGATEVSLRRAADGDIPGARACGPRRAELLRNAVASGSVATAMRQAGLKGVRTLVAGLLAAEDEDGAEVTALTGGGSGTPAATSHSADPSPQPTPHSPQDKDTRPVKRPNPFGRAAVDDSRRLPEPWPRPADAPRSAPETARPYHHPYGVPAAPSPHAPERRSGTAVGTRGGGLRFGLSTDALGRLHCGWQPRPFSPGISPQPHDGLPSLQSKRSEGVPEPDPQYELV